MSLGPPTRPVLRGYGPLAVLLVAFTLMAALVPTVAREQVVVATGATAVDGSAADVAGEDAPGAPGSGPAGAPGGPGGPGQAAANPGGTVGQPGSVPARTSGCPDRERQVPGDPYSPPCLTFSGDNGGATSKGVTKDTITVAYRETSDPGFQQTLAALGGATFSDTPETVRRTIEGLADYFNSSYQFYGRKLKFAFYEGQGSQTNELLGGGQQAAGADALKVATTLRAFADMSAVTVPYGDALARQKVIGFGAPYVSGEWLEQRQPYAWSVATDCTKVTESSVEAALKQLVGKKATFAGPALKDATRKIAILAPDNPWYQDCVKTAQGLFKAAGAPVPMSIPYALDLSTMSNQAASIVAKLKAEGITTVSCGCDPIFPVYLSSKAREQAYEPEWAVIGVALTDQDVVGQLFDQSQWAHAFGVSYLGRTTPLRATLGYNAYKKVRKDEPAQVVDLIYSQMLMLALGVQLAGPELTPQSFQTGMYSYGGGTGPFGTWGFLKGEHTPTQDGVQIYWDPEGISPYNGKKGTYVFASPRYRRGQVPSGDVPRTPYDGK